MSRQSPADRALLCCRGGTATPGFFRPTHRPLAASRGARAQMEKARALLNQAFQAPSAEDNGADMLEVEPEPASPVSKLPEQVVRPALLALPRVCPTPASDPALGLAGTSPAPVPCVRAIRTAWSRRHDCAGWTGVACTELYWRGDEAEGEAGADVASGVCIPGEEEQS